MRSAQQWLSEYAESHQNPTNKKIHTYCVYPIFWSTLALLWILPLPSFLQEFWYLNWGTLILALANVFYFSLGPKYGLPMLSISIFFCYLCRQLQLLGISLLWTGAIVFLFSWLAQFYGHKVEGKKPSFFKDVFYLLIGPLWVLEKLKSNSF